MAQGRRVQRHLQGEVTFTNKGKAGNVDADGGALADSEEDKDVLGNADGTLSVEADDIEGAADQAAAEAEVDSDDDGHNPPPAGAGAGQPL